MRTLGRLVCEVIFVASMVYAVWVNLPGSLILIVGVALGVLVIFGGVSLMDRVGALGKRKD